MSALEAAVKILSRRNYSSAEVRNKLLEKDFSEEDAEAAVSRLTELGYIKDQELAASVCRDLCRRGYGLLRVKAELNKRGFDRENTDNALLEYETNTEWMDKHVMQVLDGKMPERKLLGKLSRSLASRGFMWDEISSCIDRCMEELRGLY